MAVTATATLRPTAADWRSGFDGLQHRPVDARTAVCGEQVREQRYDRPDWPKCPRCSVAGAVTSTLRPPSADEQTGSDWAPGELTEAWGR